MVCCLLLLKSRCLGGAAEYSQGGGEEPQVVVHVGTNGMGRKRDEILQSEYRELAKANLQDREDSTPWIAASAMC